ncbi:MAG: hypothetical protein KC483_10105 [Nitrosarchaeum sp.]|nr:hypothetical protein [Nitrosarchaeum sp.]
MEKSAQLLEKITNLQNLGVGDLARLEHLRNSIIKNRKIYSSDLQYISFLDEKTHKETIQEENNCWKCDGKLLLNAKFCSFCGVDQTRQNFEVDVVASRKKIQINPVRIISNLQSYQILTVFGGLASLIPILIALANLERIFEIINFYYDVDLARYSAGFVGVGVASAVLCIFDIVISFLMKKPKKIGKILFFSSFGILGLSVMTGSIGFAMILAAGIFALKQRRYL